MLLGGAGPNIAHRQQSHTKNPFYARFCNSPFSLSLGVLCAVFCAAAVKGMRKFLNEF
jgi:hypothetical protein